MKGALLALAAGAAVAGFFALVGPLPQDPAYHRFADTRPVLGLANAWNVLSNLPLLLGGGWGLWLQHRRRLVHDNPPGAPAYPLFFLAVALTAAASAGYHLAPDNYTLFWDRLPMAVAFMALTVATLAERLDPRRLYRLLWPLVALGAASIVYWYSGERFGRGDLRPYAVVQFLPLLLLPVVCLLYRSRFSRSGDLWLVLGWYGLAKAAELLDARLFALSGSWVGGHALKHLLAAAAVWQLTRMLRRRARLDAGGDDPQRDDSAICSASSSTVRAK